MPVTSTGNISQEKQIGILSEKIENLTTAIKHLVEKSDQRDASLVAFQRDYYIEHQKLIGDVAKQAAEILNIKQDVNDVEDCADQLKTKTQPIDDIKKLRDAVFGNGNPGLVGKIDRINQWMENQVWFQRLVIGAIVGQVIVVIVLLIKGV